MGSHAANVTKLVESGAAYASPVPEGEDVADGAAEVLREEARHAPGHYDVIHSHYWLSGQVGWLAADRWAGGDSRGVVVLLHGGGQTRHSWRTAGERLAILGWTTYAVDLRGHGDSDWAPDGNYGLSGHLDDLMSLTSEIRRREPGQPLSLVGASLGGIVSLIAAGENRGLAQALVLVDVAALVTAYYMTEPDPDDVVDAPAHRAISTPAP